jgi:hypothetical protein
MICTNCRRHYDPRCMTPVGAGHWCPPCLALEGKTPAVPICAPFQHAYRGAGGGRWVCTRCGAAIASQPITTAPVEVPKPYGDVDC